MKTEMNKEIFSSDNYDLHVEYIDLLINRLTHSSMELEIDLGVVDDSKNAIRLRDNMKAFKNLLKNIFRDEKISEELIITTADLINDSCQFISNGYRKIRTEYITDSNVSISKVENIQIDINKLLQKYENEWKNLDLFEREARFHIEFIRIHPFEDGNGRTSRLLLNFNLLKHGQAPVIITNDLIEYYHRFISENDVQGMKKMFQIQSLKENEVIEQLYDEYKQKKESDIKKY